MPENVIIAYKEIGETPLECLERERMARNISPSTPMTYAGRLDPMAEGLMILLTGEECKNKEKYLGFDKTYEFEILVGFETDTYDLLGLQTSLNKTQSEESFPQVLGSPRLTARPDHSENLSSDFVLTLQSFVGTFIQKYPSFSSKTVGGKQLFQLSKDDELPDEMPEHEVTISRLECIGERTIQKEDLHKDILRRISLVRGDFRQDEIIKKWDKVFEKTGQKEFEIISLVCDCSSGTYIRQLVSDISEKIGVPMVTYSIKRTRAGDYFL